LAGVAAPLAVAVNGQTVYVCCARCAAKLRSDPESYLAKVAAERVGTSTPAPSAAPPGTVGLYGGQKTCPVTGEELDPAGGAMPVNVHGQTIYVCCPGCAAKVRKNPDLYLAKVAAERSEKGQSRP
jgi:YHS domain-containing protein